MTHKQNKTVVAECSCGRRYTAQQWQGLPYLGVMDDGCGLELELRNCTCTSTRAIVINGGAS